MYQFDYTSAYDEVIIFILLINLLLIIKLHHTEGFGKAERWISNLIIFGTVCSVSDGLCVMANGYYGRVLFYALNALFYISYAVIMMLLFEYTFSRYYSDKRMSARQRGLTHLPMFFLVLISVLSYFTKWAFFVNEDGVFIRGDWFYLFFMLGYQYVIFTFIMAVRYALHKRSDIHNLQAVVYSIPILLGPVIQMLIPGVPASNMALTLTLLCIFVNNQEVIVKRGNERAELMASLSVDYEAIHVADLDKLSFVTVKTSDGINNSGLQNYSGSYMDMVEKFARMFLEEDEAEMMIKYLEPAAMKKRLKDSNNFKYRYTVKDDGSGKYIYEMNFAAVSDNPDNHIIVIGTKCIDNILKVERERGQISTALLHDCLYFYEFDITEGMLSGDFECSEKYNPLFGKDITFPILYDEFNRIRTHEFGIIAHTEKEASYWTCEGLINAFNRGKRTVELRYSSEQLGLSWNATIILMKDVNTEHIHGIYMCRDVTEVTELEKKHQMELEKALIEAKKANAAKSDFLSRMSHDIRTPLNGIIGIMEMNERHSDDRELVDSNRSKAKVAARHLLSLINDVLDMSKLEDEKMHLEMLPINLYDICMDSLTICNIRAKERGITLHHDNGRNLKYPYVYGSELHIRQILMNILNNCVKYNKDGGDIFCTLNMLYSDEEKVRYRFVIEDTGVGMNSEYIKHIFDPFSQEKNDARSRYQGTGIGMSIVKALLDKMDGTIEVFSTEGLGSKFIISIPFLIDKEQKYNKKHKVDITKTSIKGKNILLAEDNELNMEIASCILEDAGAHVVGVMNGVEAVDTFINNREGTFDAIIMDVMMPEMDGYQATRYIRQSDKADAVSIPIIAMTANAFEEDKKKARDAGMNRHVAKPIEVDLLIETLEELIQ